MADNRQMIIDLDKKRMTAMAQKDVATLNALLADDLVYTHSSARLDTKQSLIGNMESGATVYTAVEPSDVKAQDLGDTVVLNRIMPHQRYVRRSPQQLRRQVYGCLRQQRRTLADGGLAVHSRSGIIHVRGGGAIDRPPPFRYRLINAGCSATVCRSAIVPPRRAGRRRKANDGEQRVLRAEFGRVRSRVPQAQPDRPPRPVPASGERRRSGSG